MAKKVSQKTAAIIMLFLFFGSVIAVAIEYGIGRPKTDVPDTNIVRAALTQDQQYAILSRGLVLLKYSIPATCDFYCEDTVKKVEAIAQKYSPYVFLEEVKSGTKMKLVAATYSGDRSIDNVNATAVEDTVCLAIPAHPECRRMRAMQAIENTGNVNENSSQNTTQNTSVTNAVNETGPVNVSSANQTNISLGG